MKLLFKYATRERPKWFQETLLQYYEKMSGKHDFEFIITMDEDDKSMNNSTMKEYLDQIQNLKYYYGKSSNKIEAINANMEGVEFDILIVVSDDMQPVVEDYDDIIVQDLLEHFPNLDGAIHYPDGCCNKTQENAITFSIMGKPLYDYFGYIYHPEYKSFYCDNEFRDVVYNLNKCVFIDKVPVRHTWRKYGKDSLYSSNSKLGHTDSATYAKRKNLGFPR